MDTQIQKELMMANSDAQKEFEEIARDAHILSVVQQEIENESKKRKPKWARLARTHAPELRRMYWKDGDEEARMLLIDLYENTTTPMADLDRSYADTEYGYVEVDSYTGEPIVDGSIEDAWDEDYKDIQAMVGLDEGATNLLGRIIDLRHEEIVPDYEVVIPSQRTRFINELKHLGYSDDEINAALEANDFNFTDVEDAAKYINDDDKLPSVPLSQAQEQEYVINPGMMLELKSLTREFTQALYQRRTEFFDWVNVRNIRLNLQKNYAKEIDWVYAGILAQEMIHKMFKDMIRISEERNKFLKAMQDFADNDWELQYLAVIFMSMEGDWMLDEEDADKIRTSNYGDLGTFIEIYGDMILDSLSTGIGNHGSTTENDVWATAEEIEAEIIEKQFVDSAKGVNPMHTRSYARGVFGGLAKGESSLSGAGWNNYYFEINPMSDKLRRQTFSMMKEKIEAYDPANAFKEANKAAKDVFWNAAKIVKINENGITAANLITGRTKFLTYQQAVVEMINSKLIPNDVDKLRNALTDKGWGIQLRALLG
jgi:hypothetical protein